MIRNFLILLCFFAFPYHLFAQEAGPTAIVEEFQAQLLSVMKDAEKISVQERYDRLVPTITKTFHIPTVVRIAIGDHWKRASEEQRQRIVEAFQRKNISTVATLFSGYSGQKFELLGEKPAPQNTVLVKTRITNPDGSGVSLDYRALRIQGRWYVIDVVIDGGISEMQVRQSEFRDILKKGGLEALIEILDHKADELLASK